jgi:type 1 glutamine amidotransferase
MLSRSLPYLSWKVPAMKAICSVGLLMLLPALLTLPVHGEERWVTLTGENGPGVGKHIVLMAGDHEYRSEEALPMLAKILANHHGFKCTVLFAQDDDGTVNPDNVKNMPGLEQLKSADLLILGLRFRNLVDDQMQHVADYVAAGKPIIGLRTSTHAFNIPKGGKYHDWSFNNNGGFGKRVLGETWVAHHGGHGSQSTRGLIAPGAAEHPIVRGLKDGDVWGDSDVYTVRLPLAGDCQPVLMGQVLVGMKFDDAPLAGPKNDPLMPLVWTKTYEGEQGAKGRVVTSTLGAATDFTAAGSRRMLVNAAYWCLGMEDKIPSEGTKVDLVGDYQPTRFASGQFKRGMKPVDFFK